jgi:hypothetical protein
MIDFVYGNDEIVARAVAQMIPSCRERGFGRCKAIGVVDENGTLIAGVVYHNWQPEAGVIEVSVAAFGHPRWLTRETLRRIHEYPFEQIGAQMMLGLASTDDQRLLRQLAALGYMFVLVPRLLGRDLDGVLCLFTREAYDQCKFIKPLATERKEAA